MGHCIVKLGEYYLEWSSMVDAPVTMGVTREQYITEYLAAFGDHVKDELLARLAVADEHGTSITRWGGKARHVSVEELIIGNRAGPNEQELTFEQIVEQYCPKE